MASGSPMAMRKSSSSPSPSATIPFLTPPFTPSPIILLLFALSFLSFGEFPMFASATITYSGAQLLTFPSQPALFGHTIPSGVRSEARLQTLEDDPYLCGTGLRGLLLEDDEEEGGKKEEKEDRRTLRDDEAYRSMIPSDGGRATYREVDVAKVEEFGGITVEGGTGGNDGGVWFREEVTTIEEVFFDKEEEEESSAVVVPSDGRKVALLAKRGGCSFEAKARVAQYLSKRAGEESDGDGDPVVGYVVVYDDAERSALVPMSATDGKGIDVSLLFVSLGSGLALAEIISGQDQLVTAAGGPVIGLDSDGPVSPYTGHYDEVQEYMLASLAGFFIVMACFGCLLMCAQSGLIHIDHNVIYIGPRPPGGEQGEGNRPPPLLTEEQVRSLPEVEYRPPEEADEADGGRGDRKPPALTREGEQRPLIAADSDVGPAESLLSPLPPSLLDSMTSLVTCHNDACSICLEEYEIGEKVRVLLPCGHVFHTECIVPWLTERAACCPLCKGDVGAATGDDDSEDDDDNGSESRVSETRADGGNDDDVERGEGGVSSGGRSGRGGWGGSIRSFLGSSSDEPPDGGGPPRPSSFLSRVLGSGDAAARPRGDDGGGDGDTDGARSPEVVSADGPRTPLLRGQRSPPVSTRPSGGVGSSISAGSGGNGNNSRADGAEGNVQ